MFLLIEVAFKRAIGDYPNSCQSCVALIHLLRSEVHSIYGNLVPKISTKILGDKQRLQGSRLTPTEDFLLVK